MSEDEMKREVHQLKKAVFGDMDNPKETPGVISELAQMNISLGEIRDAMRKINLTIVLGFLTALMAIVIKGIH